MVATVAMPRTGPAPQDPARGRLPLTSRARVFAVPRPSSPATPQEGAPPNSSEGIQTHPECKPYAGSQAAPEPEGLRTLGSSLDNTQEALPHEAFIVEQHVQLDAQALVSANLREQRKYGKTPMNKAVDMQKLKGLTSIGMAWNEKS